MQVAMHLGFVASLLALTPSAVSGPSAGDAASGLHVAAASQPSGRPLANESSDLAARRGAPVTEGTVASGTIFADDFESGALRGWRASGNDTATTTRSEHFSGQSAVMLKVGPTDPVNYRTEIVIADRRGKMHVDKDYCIRFAFKVKDWTNFPKWVTLFQTHAIPQGGDFSCHAGRNSITLISGSARDLALAVIDEPVARRKAGAIAEVVHRQDLLMDHWYGIQFHYRPAFDDSGVIEAWIDGKKIYAQTGANLDPNDQCGRPSEPFTNLKLGLYKERTNTGTQTIYFDDFVLAEGAECK